MTIRNPTLLFTFCFGLIFFTKPEFYFFILVSFSIFFVQYQTKKNFIQLLYLTYPIVLIIISGFLFLYGNDLYEVLKDLWLWVKVLALYLLGSFLANITQKYDSNKTVDIIVYLGLVHSIVWLALIFLGFVGENNYQSGLIKSIPILIIVLVPFYIIKHSRDRLPNIFSVIPIFISIIFSFSRLKILYFFISFVFNNKLFKFSTYRKHFFINTLIISLFTLPIIIKLIPEQTIDKFKNIKFELSYTEGDDPNAHWRSYETHKALIQFNSYNFYKKLFGGGHGTLIDLNDSIEIVTGPDTTYLAENLPVIHNGYLMILNKSGLIGIVLYFYFIYLISFKSIPLGIRKYPVKYTENVELLNITRKSIFFIILIHTYFATGLLNKYALDGVLLFLGYINQFIINQKNEKFSYLGK